MGALGIASFLYRGVRSGRGTRNEADGCLVIDGRALEYSTMFYIHSSLYRLDSDEAGMSEFPH